MQTMTQVRSVGDVLAAALLLVAAGAVVTGVTAIGLVPLPPHSHLLIAGALGSLLFFFLAAWSCRSGVGVLGALLYFVACACNGAMLAPLADLASHERVLAQLVDTAAFIAAGIFAVLALLASFLPQLLLSAGRFLVAGLIVLLTTMIIAACVQATTLQLVLDGAGILLFCCFVLYDVGAIANGRIGGAVQGAVELYLDGLNLFVDLLRLLLQMLGWFFSSANDSYWAWETDLGFFDFFTGLFSNND
jgi:FtsH-binding integral membrane protein